MQPLRRSWLSAGIDSLSHRARVLVFASPKRKFRDPTKLNRSCRSLVVPPLSQDELLDMQVTHSPSPCPATSLLHLHRTMCQGSACSLARLLACFHCSRMITLQAQLPATFGLQRDRIMEMFPLTGGVLRHLLGDMSYESYLATLMSAFGDLVGGKTRVSQVRQLQASTLTNLGMTEEGLGLTLPNVKSPKVSRGNHIICRV